MSTTAIRKTPQRRRATAPPSHNADEAALGLCDCLGCLEERRQRMTHPLLAAALKALYGLGDSLHILARNHGCDPASCELCRDAKGVWSVLATLEGTLEGEYLFFEGDPALTRLREESAVRRARPRRRRRYWRPDSHGNYPPLPLAVLTMRDLAEALGALRAGHGCGGDEECGACDQAGVYSFLVPLLTATVEKHMRPYPVVSHRRDASAGREPRLRLYEQVERS